MFVILNRTAGGPDVKPEQSDETIRDLFAQHGAAIEILKPDEATDVIALARRAAAAPDPVIVAGGGDGTISAVASVLVDTEKILGILPLGTLNHFAKDLRIPLDLPGAVATITQGHSQKVDAGEVNGRIFINNSSLGIYPRIVADREEQQEHQARGKWSAFLWATLRALRRFPFLNLKITLEGKQLTRKTAFLFVGNNQYEIAGFNLGGRVSLNAGKLWLYLTHRTGRFGLFRLAARALFGRLEEAKDFDVYCVEEAVVETQRRPHLLVATDGEVNRFQSPLHYRVRPGALRVIVPPEQEA